jgi:hypothetical protein
MAGTTVAGMALLDEVDDASTWIELPLEKFQRTMAGLGPDGVSHEGVGYWEYGAEYMLKFMDLARSRLDVNLYTNEPLWEEPPGAVATLDASHPRQHLRMVSRLVSSAPARSR